jgi:hypothetical protein
MAHTPLSPYKNRIRRDWMRLIARNMDIITISHGLLDVASVMGWRGAIQVCDIDPGVRETTEYLRSDYPDLQILKPGEDIRTTVATYCTTFGVKNLGAVDVDLACTLRMAESILQDTLNTLATHKYGGRIYLTVALRCDGFNSMESRLQWIRERLPQRFRLISHTVYSSVRIGAHADRRKGSAMLIVEIGGKGCFRKAFLTLEDRILNTVRAGGMHNASNVAAALAGHASVVGIQLRVGSMLKDGRLSKRHGELIVGI